MDYLEKDFGKILKHNAYTMRSENLDKGTDCFRVYDRNLGAFPVTVDIYGKFARITDYSDSEPDDSFVSKCIDISSRMLYLDKDCVVYKRKNKRSTGEQHEKEEKSVRTVVKESNLLFEIELASYTDTGLFLDHSKTRSFIKENSFDKDVLNLFSYTGSFSVYAASGMAKSVTSVDLSNTYTKWAQENLARNGFSGYMYPCVSCDASKFLKDAERDGKKYDIIIFDPPSFSNSHKMDSDFDVKRDYDKWITYLAHFLHAKGFILFSTNLSSFSLDRRKLGRLFVKEVTADMRAPGFVAGRTGAVRSFIMALDEDSLVLDWSEPDKESGKVYRSEEKRDSGRRDFQRKEHSEREDRHYDRPRREYDRDRDGERRFGSDRPRHEYGRDRDGERRFSSDRPRREYDRDRDGERRFGSDRPRREYDRDRDGERRFGSDRPRHEYGRDRDGERRFSSDRPRREYDNDRDGERRFGSDRPERQYGNNEWKPYDNEHDSYSERRSFRSSRSEDFNRDYRSSRPDSVRKYSDRKVPSKPYGYDSFRPAKSRDDSGDFFWRKEDLDNDIPVKKIVDSQKPDEVKD